MISPGDLFLEDRFSYEMMQASVLHLFTHNNLILSVMAPYSPLRLASLDLSGNLYAFSTPVPVPGSTNGVLLQTVNFEVKVYAGDLRGNGTDGDMSIALIGDKGQAPEKRVS